MTSTSTSSDHNTSPATGTSNGVVLEISVSQYDASGISSAQIRKADGEVTPSTAGIATISAAPPIPSTSQQLPQPAPPTVTTASQASQTSTTTSQASQAATARPAQGTPKPRTSSVRQTLEAVFAKNPSPSDAVFMKLAEALKIEDIEPVKQLFALWRRNGHKLILNPTPAAIGEGASSST